jgi:hypothetical protein
MPVYWTSDTRKLSIRVYEKLPEAARRVLCEHRGAGPGRPPVLTEHSTRSPAEAPRTRFESYAELVEAHTERLQALLYAEAYREVEHPMKTTDECGIEQGERRSALRQTGAKLGPLTLELKPQVEVLSLEAEIQLQLDLLKAQALEELSLGDP